LKTRGPKFRDTVIYSQQFQEPGPNFRTQRLKLKIRDLGTQGTKFRTQWLKFKDQFRTQGGQ
jgi:hypothetical protein